MKKLIFIISLVFGISCSSSAQIYGSAYFDGYWSSWVRAESFVKVKGSYDSFIIYSDKEGPWNYRFKFTIDNFKVPNKKQRKKDIKDGKIYEFSGTVEYYISDKFPSALDLYRESKGLLFHPAKLENGRPTKKIISKATIKVFPFKKLPRTYNIFFDNVGVGIDLGTQYFPNIKFD